MSSIDDVPEGMTLCDHCGSPVSEPCTTRPLIDEETFMLEVKFTVKGRTYVESYPAACLTIVPTLN